WSHWLSPDGPVTRSHFSSQVTVCSVRFRVLSITRRSWIVRGQSRDTLRPAVPPRPRRLVLFRHRPRPGPRRTLRAGLPRRLPRRRGGVPGARRPAHPARRPLGRRARDRVHAHAVVLGAAPVAAAQRRAGGG